MAHSQLGSSKNHEDKNENLSGIPVFWATASIAPPVEWSIWLDSFFLASDLKEGCQTRLLLQEPAAVTHEPLPKPEPPTDGENTAARNEREARNAANRAKIEAINREIDRKGPRLSHKCYYHEVETSMRSRLFFALGKEGIRRFTQKFPKVKVHEQSFREFMKLLDKAFKEEKNTIYERMLLFCRSQKNNESLESFHAALTEQASKCELGTLEEELVRDLFIAKMKEDDLKTKFIMEKTSCKKVLEEVILFERGTSATETFNSMTYPSVKQEPTFAIGSRGKFNRGRGRDFNRNRDNYRGRGNGGVQKRPTTDNETCKNCGGRWTQTHGPNCPAKGKE